MYSRITALVIALTLAATGLVSAQERFGTLQGKVTDEQGAPIPGVTVAVTNLASGEVRTFVTDASGQYTAPDLNPGRYRVGFELAGFARVERPDVSVVLGRAFQMDTQMRVGGLTETVQVTGDIAPLVDNRSTLIAHNVSAEEFDRLPKGRSFQSIALTAPSVNSGEIEGGFQVNGASGAENSFTVDGITTNSLVNGQSRQNTVFEYLQEVQVKTSGISAEYGGALGGVISAVTKSGGNTFRGEGHYFFEGSPLAAAPVQRLILEPQSEQQAFYVRDQENRNHQSEFGGSIGGPIVPDRLFFYGSYSPRIESRENLYNFTDGSDTFDQTISRQQAFGKLTFAHRRLTANWSTLWTPTSAEGSLFGYGGLGPNGSTTTLASFEPNRARGYEINQLNTSGTVDLHLTPGSFLSFRGGYFHDRYTDTGTVQTTNFRYGAGTTATLGLPAALQGPLGFENTPRTLITDFDTTKRTNFNVDYNRVFNAAGFHTFRAGYGLQHVVNDISSYYPGGYVDVLWDRAFTFGGVTDRGPYGYYAVHDRRITNKAGSDIQSLYLQDQWSLGRRLTLNLGLRTENENIPDFRPEADGAAAIKFSFADKLAPRLGAALDVFGDGRMKAFGSWGLYYDWTKYELPRGSFGAETWCTNYRALETLDLASLNLNNMPGRDIWITPGTCRDRRFQAEIDPDIKPMRQSSTSAGIEYQLGRNSVVTAHYIHNDLLETIEDIGFLTPTGDEGYVIGNPGVGLTALQYASGGTPLGFETPRPKRTYDALELGYSRRLANRWFFSANYTLSRLYGNYSGLAASDEVTTPTTGGSSATAQQQAGSIARPGGNTNRAWDSDELLWDSRGNLGLMGRLATDRPHVAKLYGSYDLPFGTQVGAFFYGGSGTPVYTYVTSTHSADLFVEGRNGFYENGQVTRNKRTPALYRTDLLLSHELGLAGNKRMRFELNVLNLFDQQTARHIFNYLNKGAIIPDRQSSLIDLFDVDLSQGYNYINLINSTTDGSNAYDPRYGMADLFEPGRRGYVSVKFLF